MSTSIYRLNWFSALQLKVIIQITNYTFIKFFNSTANILMTSFMEVTLNTSPWYYRKYAVNKQHTKSHLQTETKFNKTSLFASIFTFSVISPFIQFFLTINFNFFNIFKMFTVFQLTIIAIHILLLISQTKYSRISFSIVWFTCYSILHFTVAYTLAFLVTLLVDDGYAEARYATSCIHNYAKVYADDWRAKYERQTKSGKNNRKDKLC